MSEANQMAVLGIDAAWTENEPSGVALWARQDERWRCLRVAPSYESFCNHGFSWGDHVRGGKPDVSKLLSVCASLTGGDCIAVVAVDMPLSTQPIIGRRVADNRVSQQFGARKCAVHSPSIVRPGKVGEALNEDFISAKYELAVSSNNHLPLALLEVYPHVALLSLMQANERLKYKVSKSSHYWDCSIEDRKRLLVRQWSDIIQRLQQEVDGIELQFPAAPEQLSLQHLKRYEDAIDGLVCAWMATKYLAKDATPLGDGTAAIWIPANL